MSCRYALVLAVGVGCAAPQGKGESALVLSPDSGTAAGHFTVQLDLSQHALSPDDIDSVRVGGVKAYKLYSEAEVLSFDVQGGPPGPPFSIQRYMDCSVQPSTQAFSSWKSPSTLPDIVL